MLFIVRMIMGGLDSSQRDDERAHTKGQAYLQDDRG